MNLPPWHQETLERLGIYLRVRGRGKMAVIETTSPRLADEVVAAVPGILQPDHLAPEVIDLTDVEDHLPVLARTVRREIVRGRVTIIRGIPEIARRQRQTEPEESVPAVLRYLNFNRDGFYRDDEAFLFFVDEPAGTDVIRWAPDFNRFTLWFHFVDLQDRLKAGEAGVQPFDREQAARMNLVETEAWQMRHLEGLRRAGNPWKLSEALAEHAVSLTGLGRMQEADVAIREALEVARGIETNFPEDLARLRGLLRRQAVIVALRQGEARKAETLVREGIREVREGGGAAGEDLSLLAPLLALRGNALLCLGQAREAYKVQQNAIELQQRLGDAGAEADAHISASGSLFVLGELDEARAEIIRALELAASVGSISGRVASLMAVAPILIAQGDLRNAATLVGELRILAEDLQANLLRILATALGANLLLLHGAGAQVRRLLQHFVPMMKGNAPAPENWAVMRLIVEIYLALGPVEKVREITTPLVESATGAGNRAMAATGRMCRGLALELAGDLAAGDEELERATTTFEELGQLLLHALARMHRGRLLRRLGKPGRARTLLKDAHAFFHTARARTHEAQALTELAFLDLSQGRTRAAAEKAGQGLDILERAHVHLYTPAALAALAAVARQAGEEDQARWLTGRWRQRIEWMGAEALGSWLDACVAELPGAAHPEGTHPGRAGTPSRG